MSRRTCITAVVIAAALCAGCATKSRCDCCQAGLSQVQHSRFGGTQP